MRNIAIVFAVSLIAFIASNANAMVLGGSNLSFLGYPEPSCTKPYSKPVKPYKFRDQEEVDLYNLEVSEYNTTLDLYVSCVREYVDNANNDIRRIKEATQSAIDAANSP